jgi:EAL domain-containing protein (putative c-di-GMP-specific phosphodiesterase class I)
MKQPALPLGVAAIVAVAVSAASAAGVFAAGRRLELALAFAAVVLAAAHLVIFLYRDLYYRRRLASLNELHLRGRNLAEQLAGLSARLDMLEGGRDESPAPRASDADDLNREFEQLRLSVKKLAEEYGRPSTAPQSRRDPEIPVRPDDQSRPAVNHRLEFYLEPIVSLEDDSTVHYRASLVLEGQGQRVVFEELARQAAANGLRPDLDGHAVSRALAVARKLAAKRPGTCVFVPVGLETLGAQDTLSAIEWQMNKAGDAATSIVFEIDHAAMAALGPRGIEGLARLARYGAGMALSKAHGMGIDLQALRDLQFRFISFSAAALPTDGRSVPVWAQTARLADDHGFRIGVQGLFYEEQVNIASRWAKLGSGPVFASPRRVKGKAVSIDQIRSAA